MVFQDHAPKSRRESQYSRRNPHFRKLFGLKTTIFTIITHHHTQFRPNFLTSNKIGILIFDPNKDKNNFLVRRIVDIGDLKRTY